MTHRTYRRSLINPLTRSSRPPSSEPLLPTHSLNELLINTTTTKIYKPSTPRHPDPRVIASGPGGPWRVDLSEIHFRKIHIEPVGAGAEKEGAPC